VTADNRNAAARLADVLAEVKAVGKTGYNQQQDYAFRGVDAVTDAVAGALRTHKLVPVPRCTKVEYSRREYGSKGATTAHCAVQVEYVMTAPDGSTVTVGPIPGESTDPGMGDKGTAKAMSVAYRIMWLQLLAIPTGDPDPDSDHGRPEDSHVDPTPVPYLTQEHIDNLTARSKALPEAIRKRASQALRDTFGEPKSWTEPQWDAIDRALLIYEGEAATSPKQEALS
jgi:hypothetical protein